MLVRAGRHCHCADCRPNVSVLSAICYEADYTAQFLLLCYMSEISFIFLKRRQAVDHGKALPGPPFSPGI
ncbi:hypothetical protein J8I26_08295 [Herbaspirillum sp. LeCh32-8]|uniref:hypothetical protein n=1 Tax=Herbaspirillum sp. LeCh32-8 TaxID=2821356 RepID=UPI001AE31D2C|nr:hypothetical protein [Herbaspirillum sp. LeCh32-8]MBP0598097.1 hypothetical protein [Herbaspirillum sp. LeCh32-8]